MWPPAERLASVCDGVPLSAQPNAGKPRDVEGRNIYLCSPEYMASYARRFILHNVRVVASGANGYAAQTNVDLVITAGTVGGTSVVGYVVGSFSIENRSTQAIKAQTDLIPAAPAAVGDIPTAVQNADALLGRNVSGGSSAGRTVKQAFHFIRNKWVVAAGTLTVYDTDDSTSSWTAAVTGTAGADPVTGTDPA